MKPFLLIILFLVLALALLGSCMYTNLSGNASPAAATQANLTSTATAFSGLPPTVDIPSPVLFSNFNMTVENLVTSDPVNQLEHIAGPSYQIIGVDFLQEYNSPSALRVKTRCECAENGPCCNYTRTFVVTIMALREVYHQPFFQVPEAIGEVGVLQVWCYDHANLTKRISVPWADVEMFLDGDKGVDGFQLWAKVTPEP